MGTFLTPIENPPGLMMKMVYGMSKRQFGKVMTPLKVFVARMPLAFGMFVGKIAKLDKKLELPTETIMLVRERVARLNVCLFCIDIGRAFVIKSKMNEAKFDAMEDYATSPLFSDAERAICEIVWLVASEHVYNMSNIGLNIHSDMLCDIARKK